MNQNKWVFAIGGLIIGAALATVIIIATEDSNTEVASTQQSNTNTASTVDHSSMSMESMMDSMTANLKSKTGDEFDYAFIDEMVLHHEGAIEMAKLALTNANHLELKTMAQEIISAQEKEVNQMRQWQQTWYPGHTNH